MRNFSNAVECNLLNSRLGDRSVLLLKVCIPQCALFCKIMVIYCSFRRHITICNKSFKYYSNFVILIRSKQLSKILDITYKNIIYCCNSTY